MDKAQQAAMEVEQAARLAFEQEQRRTEAEVKRLAEEAAAAAQALANEQRRQEAETARLAEEQRQLEEERQQVAGWAAELASRVHAKVLFRQQHANGRDALQ